MTLSSASRQHRKSMLPTPRLSSRLSSRRTTSGETSRIARRVPSPMLAVPASLISGSGMHSRVPHPPANRSLPPPEFGTRRACSPSRIPSPSVQPSSLMPEQSETSSPACTPRAEGGSTEAPYPTPPASVETKPERCNGQDGRTKAESFAQHQSTGMRCPPPPARHPTRRRESTALTGFSRTENSTPGDASSQPVAHKKLAMSSSVSGKENRRPSARTRVLVSAAPEAVVPPRPIQRTTATHTIPSSETSPLPLIIKKKSPQSLVTSAGQDLQAKPAAEPAVAPAGIKALMGDLDRFAKGWTGMFDELYASAGSHGDVFADASTRMHPIVESENQRTSQVDDLREETRNSRETGGTKTSPDYRHVGEMTAGSLTPSASAGSISTIQASSTNGETVHFDVSAASLARWQHRDNTILKNALTSVDMVSIQTSMFSEYQRTSAHQTPELRAVISASKSDSPADIRPARQSAPQPITPRAPRIIRPLPEVSAPLYIFADADQMTKSRRSISRRSFLALT